MRARPRSVLFTLSRTGESPWWSEHLNRDALPCALDHRAIRFDGPRLSHPFSLRFAGIVLRTARALLQARREGYQYVFTFECGWASFIIAALQTLFWSRRPRHVILQFIMRERNSGLASRVKYAFMRWCFSSVHMCICSSRTEGEYYRQAFGWPAEKIGYVPLHTAPEFLHHEHRAEEAFVVSAGRTFRDYATALKAFRDTSIPLKIIASPDSVKGMDVPPSVSIVYDIPLAELIELIARSSVVVVPLVERQISIGQTVLLQAMALGKPVVVTSVNGTVDYVEHMRTGVFVPPRDADALRDAVTMLMADPGLRQRIGQAAREHIARKHLPQHYAEDVAALLVPAPLRAVRPAPALDRVAP